MRFTSMVRLTFIASYPLHAAAGADLAQDVDEAGCLLGTDPAVLCLAVKPGHLSPDIAPTVQCGLPEGSLFRHFFRNIGKGSLAVPMPLLNGAGWWFDSLAPRECLSDHRRDESVAIKRLGSKETGISHLLIM